MDTLPTMLRQRRAELAVSAEVAAVQIGTTRVTYSSWEKGNTVPSARWVEPLCEWLDAPRWKVLFGIGLLDEEAATVLVEHLGGYLVPAAAAVA